MAYADTKSDDFSKEVVVLQTFSPSALSPIFVDVDVSAASNPHGKFVRTSLTEISFVLSDAYGGAFSISRSDVLIGNSASGCLFACIPLVNGFRMTQEGRSVILRCGDVIFTDPDQALRFDFPERSRIIWVRIPHLIFGSRFNEIKRAVGLVMDGRKGLTRIVARTLVLSAEEAASVEPGNRPMLVDSLIDMLCGAARSIVPYEQLSHHNSETLRRIRTYIESHLSDDRLSPSFIATQCNISLRRLHKLFEVSETTVSRFVTERRLERCYGMLRNVQHRNRLISDIALANGFGSIPGFNRAFKAHFDMPPGEVRRSIGLKLK